MNRIQKLVAGLVALACVALAVPAFATTDATKRLFDRAEIHVATGTAVIDTSTANWTTYQPIVTIAPQADHALYNARIVVDLAKASTGFAAGYTSETIVFCVQRKVDGTNWRTSTNLATTAVSGTNSASCSIELALGEVTPTEQIRIVVKLSAEGASNTDLPFVLTYRAGAAATITPSS